MALLSSAARLVGELVALRELDAAVQHEHSSVSLRLEDLGAL
jgi:hypothetical protein